MPRARAVSVSGTAKLVDVVVHQAIGPNLQGVLVRIDGQPFQVGLPIFVIKKDCGPVVVTLNYISPEQYELLTNAA